MIILEIDGVEMPPPSDYKTPNMDLHADTTTRDEMGYTHIDRVRQGVYKLELEWTGIDSNKVRILKNAVKPASFSVKLITENGLVTKNMYVSDRSQKMVKYNDDHNKIIWNLSFNLVEL